MSIKMNVGGIEVTISDPAEAAALLRELDANPPPKSARKRANGGATAGNYPVNADLAEKALRFLKVIDDADGPLSTSAIMDALDVKTGNAVGGATKKVNSLLSDLGYRKHLVYRNERKPRQPRTWSSGRDIQPAITALEQKINGQK